jgi:hypothetical protein
MGYLNNPEKTAEVSHILISNAIDSVADPDPGPVPFLPPGSGMSKTKKSG